ncbi:MAG: hypothetical protein IPJ07_20570 [Acidobacteria bacterium]|nr:hypothetical protein [Acidobacteriota bacterium]
MLRWIRPIQIFFMPQLISVAARRSVSRGGPGSALYKTSDGGSTWTRLTNGLPSGDVGRIGMDIYRKNPNVVYALFEIVT